MIVAFRDRQFFRFFFERVEFVLAKTPRVKKTPLVIKQFESYVMM